MTQTAYGPGSDPKPASEDTSIENLNRRGPEYDHHRAERRRSNAQVKPSRADEAREPRVGVGDEGMY